MKPATAQHLATARQLKNRSRGERLILADRLHYHRSFSAAYGRKRHLAIVA